MIQKFSEIKLCDGDRLLNCGLRFLFAHLFPGKFS